MKSKKVDEKVSRRFVDTSTDCAICLDPLESHRVITLSCGHKWHYGCIVEQLLIAQPTPKDRILFTGCQCAKCGSICDHQDLQNITRSTDLLRGKVESSLCQQLALEKPDFWKKAQHDPKYLRSTLDHALRKYAFYLCSNCHEPYFGGTVDCANVIANEENHDERLCIRCSPQAQDVCRNPLEHRGNLVWKCRYCCQPSTFVCYGNVHFCDECHERNSQRVRELQQIAAGRSAGNKPPPLSPIPCPGECCPYPNPPNSSTHSNGQTTQSEQVYNCACCQSNQPLVLLEVPGSRNLLFNSSGQFGLQGWCQRNRYVKWTVERSEVPVNNMTETNFVSSYKLCVMSQRLDLSSILRTLPVGRSFEISARYMGRTDCPSTFRLEAGLFDEHKRRIAHQMTPILQTPPDYWERAQLVLQIPPSSRYLKVVVKGKDSRYWSGEYGAKVTELSVRLLGSADDVERFI